MFNNTFTTIKNYFSGFFKRHWVGILSDVVWFFTIVFSIYNLFFRAEPISWLVVLAPAFVFYGCLTIYLLFVFFRAAVEP